MSANHENMETIERKGDRKVKKISKIIAVSAVVAVLGFGANTFAHMGKGYDSSGRGNSGPGWNHNRDYGGSGYGHMMGDLNNDEIKRLDEERGAFFKATENTRQEIYQKERRWKASWPKKIRMPGQQPACKRKYPALRQSWIQCELII